MFKFFWQATAVCSQALPILPGKAYPALNQSSIGGRTAKYAFPCRSGKAWKRAVVACLELKDPVITILNNKWYTKHNSITSMKKTSQNNLIYYQFSHIKRLPGIVHGIFTRIGGFSNDPYHSLNLSFNVGDDPIAVQNNIQHIVNTMGLSQWQSLKQTHSCKVHVIDAIIQDPLIGDALITDQPDILLLVKTADCQPVLLTDPVNHRVAAIHSGWRGSVQNIIGKTIVRMVDLGTRPQNIIAGIGPSLGPCCSEFIHYQQELPEYMWSYAVRPNFFNFWEISKSQLQNAGFLEKNIEISKMCTKCNTDTFFSYRRKKISGRFGSVIGINKK